MALDALGFSPDATIGREQPHSSGDVLRKEKSVQIPAVSGPPSAESGRITHDSSVGRNVPVLTMLGEDDPGPQPGDPGTVILTCANCGAEMIERKCKLICRCGYFLSCSDYY